MYTIPKFLLFLLCITPFCAYSAPAPFSCPCARNPERCVCTQKDGKDTGICRCIQEKGRCDCAAQQCCAPKISVADIDKTLIIHDRGLFDEACAVFKSLYDAGLRNHTITSKLMLHALRTQNWDEAAQYNVTEYWWYNQDMRERTVLLTHDGGFGDAIMFMRYAKHLHTAGARVIVQTPTALIPLFSLCPFIDSCVQIGTPVPADCQFRVSTPDLTLTMRTTLNEPSQDIPYMFADETLVTYWSTRLAPDTHVRIGICWASSYLHNPRTGHNVPSHRCIPLELFGAVCDVADCTFYSLVKGYGENDVALHTRLPIITFPDLDTTHGGFMDTAALMKNFDLIITVDTSIAHLAGALGMPAWVIVPASSDFRWFVQRTDSPWYPTMRLFRQATCGDWKPVMCEVREALKVFAHGRKNISRG
jgi:hypothetical protein